LASITPWILSTTCLTKAFVVWISPSSATDLTLPPYLSTGCFYDFSLAFDCSALVLFPLVEVNDSMMDACLRAASKSLGF